MKKNINLTNKKINDENIVEWVKWLDSQSYVENVIISRHHLTKKAQNELAKIVSGGKITLYID